MAKERSSKPPSTTYGIKLTAVMVVFAWVGMQLLFLGAAFCYRALMEDAAKLAGCGIVLLLYSFNLKLRLDKREMTPLREQAQLFYGVMFVVLPVLTFILRLYVYHRWMKLGFPFWAGSVVTTVFFLIMFLLVLKSELHTYPRAGREAWSRRVVRMMRAPLDRMRQEPD